MDPPQGPPSAGGPSPTAAVVDVPVVGPPNAGDVSAMISATIPSKRKRFPQQFFEGPSLAAAPPAAAPSAATPAAAKKVRMKTKAAGPRGAPQPKLKTKQVSRIGLAPPPSSKATAPPPSDAMPALPPPTMDVDKVFVVESTTSYMDMLNDSVVDLDAGIDGFDGECNVEDIDDGEEDEGDEEEVVEVDPAAAGSSSTPKPRTANYTEIEDATLVRAWSKVGMDACTGVDQGGKRYWQRIEDLYHQLKPRTKSMADRSYRSLEGRWNIIKPACSRWSAAMDQVADNPPSGTVPKDYWKLRDNEPKCKKEALLTMDDEAEDMSATNVGKPEGNKKAKERVKVEAEAASFREKLDQLMKSKETLTMKTLETKLLITEKKKEVKLAKVEARREDAKRKAELDLRMLDLKQAKAMKELLAEERDIMMMRTDGMDEDQLAWWKETKADIMVRKKVAREARDASAQGQRRPGLHHLVWSRLHQFFLDTSASRYLYLSKAFHNCPRGNLSVSDYASKLQGLADDLAVIGRLVSDNDLTAAFLDGLDKGFWL
ncbi:hypothetical protein QYE76_018784 [Lolium multiflorum]|uniref:No apical meristem-associated C-terminal domain-containing protein n=1 Tax=Lolium multiflorum TaxID=4521 RepID=A0AAD8QIR2_LOLMU|nr:hypothetical protein QYE76_018784 [Lolium multiflorum]